MTHPLTEPVAPLPLSMEVHLSFRITLCACAILVGLGSACSSTQERPNFLVVVGDDMTYTDAGCYGSPDVRTPTLDRLAEEGMKFANCFTSTAMCAPTRHQLYTGLFPVRSGGYPNHSRVRDGTKSFPHFLGDLGYRVGLAGKSHVAPSECFPFEIVTGSEFETDLIRGFLDRDSNQPFCLFFCSKEPHQPWNRGDPHLYDPSTITVPPYLVDVPETREMLVKYFAEITYLDGQLDSALNLLDEAGHRENTIVVFLSEQGSNFPHCKWTCYDTGLRASCVVRWPGHIGAGSETDAMIQYVDILPTLIEAAGGDPVEGLDGKSFLGVLKGETDDHREVTYGVQTTRSINNGSLNYPIRSIRTITHKYIWNLNHTSRFENTVTKLHMLDPWRREAKTNPAAKKLLEAYSVRPAEELYDVREDPYELHNLATNPQNRPLMNSLRERLVEWMDEQGDRGTATELEAEQHLTPRRAEKFARFLREKERNEDQQ